MGIAVTGPPNLTPEQIIIRDKCSDKGRIRILIMKVWTILSEKPEQRNRKLSPEYAALFATVKPNFGFK